MATRASMIPTGSPRRILSLISSMNGSAEQGSGGQQPPVESFGVFIDFWLEAVPHLGRYFFFTLLLPTQPHFLRDKLLGELRSERQSPAILLLRAQ
jgi:hypothetical protein